MAKKDCPEGCIYDTLVKDCVRKPHDRAESRAVTKPPTESFTTFVKQLRTSTITATAVPKVMLPPALWISVGVVTVGTMLVLSFWFMIYRRQSRRRTSSSSEAAHPEQDPLQKSTKVHPPGSQRNGQMEMYQRAAEATPPCHHLHPGARAGGSQWEGDFTVCSRPSELTGTEVGVGLPACSSVTEHRIPLPATELGGTALVTTKTV